MMRQYRLPFLVVLGAVILFCLLYFGSRTRPLNRAEVDKSRSLKAQSTFSTSTLVSDAKKALGAEALIAIEALEESLEAESDPIQKIEILKKISGEWYQLSNFATSATYAEQIAEQTGAEEGWAIAGTTYSICYQRTESEEVRAFCVEKAIRSLEQATSINPSNSTHQLNLALAYIEKQPMAGIQMLLQIIKDEPENTAALMALGDMSVRSGQLDKAVGRYQQVLKIDENHLNANLGLAKVYESKGDKVAAIKFYKKSRSISDNSNLNQEIEAIIKRLN